MSLSFLCHVVGQGAAEARDQGGFGHDHTHHHEVVTHPVDFKGGASLLCIVFCKYVSVVIHVVLPR